MPVIFSTLDWLRRLQIAISCACLCSRACRTLRAGSRISRYCPLARSSATPLEPQANEGAPRAFSADALYCAWGRSRAPLRGSRLEVTIAGAGPGRARPRTGAVLLSNRRALVAHDRFPEAVIRSRSSEVADGGERLVRFGAGKCVFGRSFTHDQTAATRPKSRHSGWE